MGRIKKPEYEYRKPVTALTGSLGSGKTTPLKSLLMLAHQRQLSMCVIVNDMNGLDVDGVLIASTEIKKEQCEAQHLK